MLLLLDLFDPTWQLRYPLKCATAGHEGLCCTALWSSPEALGAFDTEDENRLTGKADIFSLACSFVQLLSNRVVFKKDEDSDLSDDELSAAVRNRHAETVGLPLLIM